MSSLSISIDPRPGTSAVAFPRLDLVDFYSAAARGGVKLISERNDSSMLNCLYILDIEMCSAIFLSNASASVMVLLPQI